MGISRGYNKKEFSQQTGKHRPRRPRSKKEEAEFGRGRKEYLLCSECGSWYFHKSWHTNIEEDTRHFFVGEENIQTVVCPPCRWRHDKQFEGELVLENIPQIFRESVHNLIRNYDTREQARDPMDRILHIEESNIGRPSGAQKRGAVSRKSLERIPIIRILTSENQMAVQLAKKISETFGGKLKPKITYSHEEDIVRVKVTFQ